MNAATIIIYIAAALLVIFGIYHTVQKFRGRAKSSCCGTPEIVSAKKVEDTDESHYPYVYLLSVEGMKCSNCASNVENALDSMNGVWARVSLGRREARVLAKSRYEKEDFEAALAKTSYKIANFKDFNS